MCRSIKTLHNFAPPATDEEVRAAALQYVRKLSGSRTPSKINEAAFERAADSVKQLFGFYEELWGGPQNEFCVCYGKPVKTG